MPDILPTDGTILFEDPATSLSKRAARRIIQRAFVLMGRDKVLRQQIRESEITTLWVIEDWELAWTVLFHRGRFEVERREAKRPDVTLTWATAQEFFQQVDRSGNSEVQVQMVPAQEHRRLFETILRGFFANLRHVLSNPVDDVGESLL
jgi:hypothetical protein